MVVNKTTAARNQPIDEGLLYPIQVKVLETQTTDSAGTGNDSMILSEAVTASASTLTTTESRPYIIKSTVDAHLEIKQFPNGVAITDATTSSYPIAANAELETFLQEGAEVSHIRNSSDGTIFIIPA